MRIADELYRVPPEQFIAERNQRVAAARQDGNRTLPAALARLRRPTTRPGWSTCSRSIDRRRSPSC
jgi:hypothetical protein